ncbi:MAG: flagellar biosynthetic protein FliO [Pseudomonadota bacterium]
MDALSPDRLIAVALFLGALALLWVVVRLNRTRLADGFRQGKRLEVAEIAALGPDTRAVLLQVDGARILVVSSKRSGMALHELSARPPATDPLSAKEKETTA